MSSNTPVLLNGSRTVDNIFELLSYKEDSISLAIAWALRSSPRLLLGFLEHLVGAAAPVDNISIQVHRHESNAGITDIEIESPGILHIIVEAKRGWLLPGIAQLRKYAKRISFSGNRPKRKLLVTLSECSAIFARSHMTERTVEGVPVTHISWKTLASWCRDAGSGASQRERHLLQDLAEYLEIVMTSQRQDSNEVYVVSLGSNTPKGWDTSWIDVVERYRRYFHPVGGSGWPKEPPNYLAFRSQGRLQSIHHVESYGVIENLKMACAGIPDEPTEPHFLYHLGLPIVPGHVVKNGKIWPNGRYWCAIDTLLTCKTVAEARDASNKRRSKPSD
jgi:hypothetical protein